LKRHNLPVTPWKIVAVNDSRVSPRYVPVKQPAVMFHNDCASRRRGERETVLSQLVGNADLTEGRLLDRQRAMASSIACSTRFSTPASCG
jgi:hypothetical protein